MREIETQFHQHLLQHAHKNGFLAPPLLIDYLTELLSSRLTRVDLVPDPSFGERYMILLSNCNYAELKDYADSCLFFTSLMPEYGKRRGLSMDYYATLGVSSYYSVGDHFVDDRYIQMGNWFYHLQKFLNTAIHPEQRLELFNF